MRPFVTALLGLAGLLAFAHPTSAEDKGGKNVPAVLNFRMKDLTGKDAELARYQGKVILVVNVASQCGYTPQYQGLEALHEKYSKDGLVVLGVPSNDFGAQEPGSNDEIAKFCQTKYGVKFDMLAKVVVKGEGQVPLYKHLTSKDTNPRYSGPIRWNFTKFLIGRNGDIVGRFEPNVKPEAQEFVSAIETELAKK
jgi:glutathione peroxidase